MKNVYSITLLGLVCVSLNSLAAGPWIEGREAYNTGTRQHEFMMRGGYGFANGAGIMLTNAYSTNKWNQFKHSYNELESWYPLFRVTPQFTILPALILTDNSRGSTVSPYVDFNYKFTPDFNVTARYRYNHKNYEIIDNNGHYNDDSTHQFVMYWNVKINDKWAYTFEPDYYIHINDFHANNGRSYSWELNNKLIYSINSHWKPYIEASWLDRTIAYHREQYRFRTGVRYYF
ncbi:oligogalacturonate-specific porin KdgM family protein [Martelella alba]|uniref:Porin OmpL n=1 Tax=Martelella alba TaxID=2590451 RepID=A0ABY2SHB9_9HYPH|nr:oligogalacturonate-specific porin KdgM family protein [Martelella alba]TKI04319.1 porin OmpL [Martelella alba]